jgi:hypothetical protein
MPESVEHEGRTPLSLSARWCCFLTVEGSMCPLAVAVAHTQPSEGIFAASQRALQQRSNTRAQGEASAEPPPSCHASPVAFRAGHSTSR